MIIWGKPSTAPCPTYKNSKSRVNEGPTTRGHDRICAGYAKPSAIIARKTVSELGAQLGQTAGQGEYTAGLAMATCLSRKSCKPSGGLHPLSLKKWVLYTDYELSTSAARRWASAHGPIVYQTPYYSLLGARYTDAPFWCRALFDEIGFFGESCSHQDYHLWYRALGKYRFHHKPQILVKTRHTISRAQGDAKAHWIQSVSGSGCSGNRRRPVKIGWKERFAFYSRWPTSWKLRLNPWPRTTARARRTGDSQQIKVA